MPKIIKDNIDPQAVVDFFQSLNTNPGNAGLAHTILTWPRWCLTELTPNEFSLLECQTEPHSLLKDIQFDQYVEKYKRSDVIEKYNKLLSSEQLHPLILRPASMEGASFYLEDGTGRSVAIKKYLSTGNDYKIIAYIGFS